MCVNEISHDIIIVLASLDLFNFEMLYKDYWALASRLLISHNFLYIDGLALINY